MILDGKNMTHDELLVKINKTDPFNDESCAAALRAVVELHKPTPENRYPENFCQGCSMTEEGIYIYYPCQTIQIIEKELS